MEYPTPAEEVEEIISIVCRPPWNMVNLGPKGKVNENL